MNIANRELCQELYGLSGWRDTSSKYMLTNETGAGSSWSDSFGTPSWESDIPAYDLGYLMRKLPFDTSIKVVLGISSPSAPTRQYIGWSLNDYANERSDRFDIMYFEDSPENTACKLAIELLKRGNLKRD